VFDENVEKLRKKHILIENKDKFLSNWIHRPAGTKTFPPFGSAINVKSDNLDARDRISEGFLASLMCKGNDLQNQNYTAILSGPYVSAGAHSITADLFEKSLVVHAVRRIPKADWINDRDQFMQPNKKPSKTFINNCVVWSLFSNSNETVTMKDVVYKNQTYQIHNNFFPFRVQEVKKWEVVDREIKKSLSSAENRFVAEWLHNESLSKEAEEVISKGKKLYKFYFENFNKLSTNEFKIHDWDAGWWQIRNALLDQNLGLDLLESLKAAHSLLKENILPQIFDYGFLSF
jgi:hypothetical protein